MRPAPGSPALGRAAAGPRAGSRVAGNLVRTLAEPRNQRGDTALSLIAMNLQRLRDPGGG